MNKAGQKLYTSIEISPNFAGTNKAYLVGLAVTDSPASLGTEMLAFAAAQGTVAAARRKIDPANLFSVAEEFQLELADEANPDPATGLLGRIAAFFDGLATQRPADPALPPRHRPRRAVGPARPVPTRRPLPRWARP
jgi:hypothetical protein